MGGHGSVLVIGICCVIVPFSHTRMGYKPGSWSMAWCLGYRCVLPSLVFMVEVEVLWQELHCHNLGAVR